MSDSPAQAGHLARNLARLGQTRSPAQGGLAKAAAAHRSTIATPESGTGKPSRVVLVKVAAALGVPMD
jgi:DNA-binding XRE family transcriptional regulator